MKKNDLKEMSGKKKRRGEKEIPKACIQNWYPELESAWKRLQNQKQRRWNAFFAKTMKHLIWNERCLNDENNRMKRKALENLQNPKKRMKKMKLMPFSQRITKKALELRKRWLNDENKKLKANLEGKIESKLVKFSEVLIAKKNHDL